MNDILCRVGMLDCKPLATPIPISRPITSTSTKPHSDPTQYHSLAGTLQYLTVSCPNLSYAVNRLCQHMHSPTSADWCALKHVLHYVKGTLHFGLRLQKSASIVIYAFSDSDCVGCLDDRKSNSGFAVFLGSNLISWVCCKQHTVVRSSTEAEYKGLGDVSAEVV